jgi:putative tricarboxylic transport membrane protein
MKRKVLFALIAAFVLIGFAQMADAAGYPDKPIEFINHTAAGGGADAFNRMIALFLNNEGIVKPRITVINRPGGSGTVAINDLASRKGDPNVLMAWTTAPVVTLMRGTTTVKDVLDLTMICNLVEDPNILIVRGDSPYKTLKDLIEEARKNPDKIKGGIGSIGSGEHIVISRMEKAAGVKFNLTSFGGQSFLQILGGHIDFSFATPAPAVIQSVTAGKLRMLAVAGDKRNQVRPEIPTMKEQGVNASFRQLRGFWGPPKMPDYAVKFWEQAFAKLSEIKGFKDHLLQLDMENDYMGPEQLRTFMPVYANELAGDLKDLEVYGGKK